MPAPTASTAMMVFAPPLNFVGSLSSTSWGRSRRRLRPFMLSSFLVETTCPSTRARNMHSLCSQRGPRTRTPEPRNLGTPCSLSLRQHRVHVVVRPRDDVHTDQLALHVSDGLRA